MKELSALCLCHSSFLAIAAGLLYHHVVIKFERLPKLFSKRVRPLATSGVLHATLITPRKTSSSSDRVSFALSLDRIRILDVNIFLDASALSKKLSQSRRHPSSSGPLPIDHLLLFAVASETTTPDLLPLFSAVNPLAATFNGSLEDEPSLRSVSFDTVSTGPACDCWDRLQAITLNGRLPGHPSSGDAFSGIIPIRCATLPADKYLWPSLDDESAGSKELHVREPIFDDIPLLGHRTIQLLYCLPEAGPKDGEWPRDALAEEIATLNSHALRSFASRRDVELRVCLPATAPLKTFRSLWRKTALGRLLGDDIIHVEPEEVMSDGESFQLNPCRP